MGNQLLLNCLAAARWCGSQEEGGPALGRVQVCLLQALPDSQEHGADDLIVGALACKCMGGVEEVR
jgi:hypothetical protein